MNRLTPHTHARILTLLDATGDDATTRLLTDLTVRWLLCTPPEDHDTYLLALDSWLAHGVPPQTAQPIDIRTWVAAMRAGLTPRERIGIPTIKKRLAGVSSWYQFLLGHGACDTNPVERVRPDLIYPPFQWSNTPGAAASAVMVEQSRADAQFRGTEDEWRNCALATILFTAPVTPQALIEAQMTDLIGLGDPDEPLVLWTGTTGQLDPYQTLPPTICTPLRRYLNARARRNEVPPSALGGHLFITQGRSFDYGLTTFALERILNHLLDRAMANASIHLDHGLRRPRTAGSTTW